MVSPHKVTLFVGHDPDSDKALKIVNGAGISLHVVDCTGGRCDFEPPLLISPWGVFDGLTSISWFGRLAAEQVASDDPVGGG